MKVLLVNGSTRKGSNTGICLNEIAQVLEDEGIETETYVIPGAPLRDCTGCGACSKLNGSCAFGKDDGVNAFIERAKEGDGFVFGTPVYYAHPSGRILAFMDRVFYAGGKYLAHKPAAGIAVARRGGTETSYDALNKHFGINQMPIVSSTYWSNAFGRKVGEVEQDVEGMATMRNIGRNMAWLLKCIEAGKAAGIEVPEAERAFFNFVR